MLRIVTFLYGTKYTYTHAARLFHALDRNLKMDWEPVLITDRRPDKDPAEPLLPGTRVVPLWTEMNHLRNCGVRLPLFQEAARDLIGPRFAWVDLDLLPVRECTHFFSRQEPFVICATPRPPMHYNASIVLMDAGARPEVYSDLLLAPDEYTRRCTNYSRQVGLGFDYVSDECWIEATLRPGEATFTRESGLVYYRNHLEPHGMLPQDATIVLFNGKRYDPASPELQRRSPWIKQHWR